MEINLPKNIAFLVTGDFNSPFMMMWFSTSLFLISFILEFIMLKIEINKEQKEKEIKLSILAKFKEKFNENTISLKKLFIISIPLTIINVSNNWLYAISLLYVDPSVLTALFQKVRILKTLSVIVFMVGVACIAIVSALSPSSSLSSLSDNDKVKGYVLIIASAFLWALYEVGTSKYIGGDHNRTIINTYMGFMGIIDLILGIPVIAILNVTKFEVFNIPSPSLFGLLFLNGLLFVLCFLVINWGLSVTSPLFVRSGELMALPLTLLFDIIVKNMKFPLPSIPGYFLIIIGFIISIYIESKRIKKNQRLQQQEQMEIQLKEINNQKIIEKGMSEEIYE
ncbi:hypothetical protein RB653_005222 [Dictyostelium firmibasis]|uniref:EamA domain-containing protein n=1 Tax=Dictyostelium firmibasis TaxID=79012 RepID=A0AAN7YST4_9MYCE